MRREEKAEKLFKEGYNCSQAVVGAFSDLISLDKETLMKLSSSFGGGMGRLREVCGAVSGMFIVLGLIEGYSLPDDNEGKKAQYEKIQALAKEFECENCSIICRELLKLSVKKEEPTPETRTDGYYKKRPCVELVKSAVRILEKSI